MRSLSLEPTTVWVPKERVIEIKLIAVRMIQEGTLDLEPSQRQLSFAQFLSNKKTKFLRTFYQALRSFLSGSILTRESLDAKNKLT